MSVEDDLAVIKAARIDIADTVSLVNAALRPLADAPDKDTDAVADAVNCMWFVDEDLAWSEERIQRRSDGGE